MYRDLVDESTASFTVFTAMIVYFFDDSAYSKRMRDATMNSTICATEPRVRPDSRLRLAARESPET